jgi:hypothetical protein
MEHFFFPFGIAFVGIGALSALASIAYPVFTLWMIIDGILRSDAEYPGTETNRKVLWVVAMVLIQPVVIIYFFAVFLKVRRTRRVAPAQYTTSMAPPAQ